MAFEEKWSTIPEEKRSEIVKYAKKTNPREAAKLYYNEIGFDLRYLQMKLTKILGIKKEVKPEVLLKRAEKNKLNDKRDQYNAVKLTWKENKLLKNIAEGKVGLEEASRIIAAKAFEKLLKDPTAVTFNNFLQSELLKIRKDEVESKNSIALELMNRMFAGQLPPTICPHCGKSIYELKPITGKEEVIDVESLPAPRDY